MYMNSIFMLDMKNFDASCVACYDIYKLRAFNQVDIGWIATKYPLEGNAYTITPKASKVFLKYALFNNISNRIQTRLFGRNLSSNPFTVIKINNIIRKFVLYRYSIIKDSNIDFAYGIIDDLCNKCKKNFIANGDSDKDALENEINSIFETYNQLLKNYITHRLIVEDYKVVDEDV